MDLKTLPLRRRVEERVARTLLLASSLVAVAVLAWLLGRLAIVGLPHIDAGFFTSFPSRRPEGAGIKAALAGSAWLVVLALLLALPIGVAAGIYMNEYARANGLTRTLRVTIANLAGVPSVVFGLLGLAIFVRGHGIPLGRFATLIGWAFAPFSLARASLPGFLQPILGPVLDIFIGGGAWLRGEPLGFVVLAGAMTLAILSLPVIIVATEEALKSVPKSMREAAYGLGATKWQVTKDHVLPYAMPGIVTGAILALARAVGETAPLILVGGATAIFFMPESPLSLYSALPLQTFYWALNPKAEFRELAAAATVVLLAFILAANLVALLVRNRYQKKLRW